MFFASDGDAGVVAFAQVMRQLKKIAENNREKFNVLSFSRQNTNFSRRLCEGGYTCDFRRAMMTRQFSKNRITTASKKSLVLLRL